MSEEGFDLVLELTLDAPRQNVWRCWTEAELLKQWFTPHPWTTTAAEIELRPGGRMNITMCSPDGEEMPTKGVVLDVVHEERLVTTDAYTAGWRPAEKPFMTTIIALRDAGPKKTTYRAVARHWSEEDRVTHREMGFTSGWTAAARQLESLAKTLEEV